MLAFNLNLYSSLGCGVAEWLRHCSWDREVAGSNPSSVLLSLSVGGKRGAQFLQYAALDETKKNRKQMTANVKKNQNKKVVNYERFFNLEKTKQCANVRLVSQATNGQTDNDNTLAECPFQTRFPRGRKLLNTIH